MWIIGSHVQLGKFVCRWILCRHRWCRCCFAVYYLSYHGNSHFPAHFWMIFKLSRSIMCWGWYELLDKVDGCVAFRISIWGTYCCIEIINRWSNLWCIGTDIWIILAVLNEIWNAGAGLYYEEFMNYGIAWWMSIGWAPFHWWCEWCNGFIY